MFEKELITLLVSGNRNDIEFGIGIARNTLNSEELRDLKRILYKTYPSDWIIFGPLPKNELGPGLATTKFWNLDDSHRYSRITF